MTVGRILGVVVGSWLAFLFATGGSLEALPWWVGQACEQREARQYPALVEAAQVALQGREVRFQRFGTCEETGEPRATLVADLGVREPMRHSIRLLQQRGWTSEPDSPRSLVSSDGELEAWVGRSGPDGGGEVYVQLSRAEATAAD